MENKVHLIDVSYVSTSVHVQKWLFGIEVTNTLGHMHQYICNFPLPRADILPQKATPLPPPKSMIWKDSQTVT